MPMWTWFAPSMWRSIAESDAMAAVPDTGYTALDTAIADFGVDLHQGIHQVWCCSPVEISSCATGEGGSCATSPGGDGRRNLLLLREPGDNSGAKGAVVAELCFSCHCANIALTLPTTSATAHAAQAARLTCIADARADRMTTVVSRPSQHLLAANKRKVSQVHMLTPQDVATELIGF